MAVQNAPEQYYYGNEPIDQVDVGGSQPATGQQVSYDPTTYQELVSDVPLATGPVFTYKSKLGRYPGNNKQWWVARAPANNPDTGAKAGDFLPELLATFYSGNNRAPRGHYVLNQFRKDRSLVSGVANLPIQELDERPNSVTFFSGRAWFGCQSTVYYSQILDGGSASKAGLCYQEADPTAEDISDLIASDGGVVPIPEADHIEYLQPMNNGVVVFAQNGVWFVSGGDQAFSALNVSVSKISPIGTKCPTSIVETDGTIFWWSEVGIQAIQQSGGSFGNVSGRFGNTNIAEATIQTFFNEISPTAKHYAKGILDQRNNLIYWLYGSSESSRWEYDRVLVYDITLQAFYPWQVSTSADGPRINGIFLDSGYLDSAYEEQVVSDSQPVTDAGLPVTTAIKDVSVKPSAIYYLTQVPRQGLTVSAPVNSNFCDWEAYDGNGLEYDSFLLTGFELSNDAMRDKQIIYLFAHFRKTESDLGDNPSSCRFQARWDWADDRNPRKWSTEIEAYRLRSTQDSTVVTSKNKVRGSGKSVQFRFGTSERGRTFDLLGWSVAYSGNTQP